MKDQEINQEIAKLTKGQLEMFKSLVRFGDNKELALKTVLEIDEVDKSFYEFAYFG